MINLNLNKNKSDSDINWAALICATGITIAMLLGFWRIYTGQHCEDPIRIAILREQKDGSINTEIIEVCDVNELSKYLSTH